MNVHAAFHQTTAAVPPVVEVTNLVRSFGAGTNVLNHLDLRSAMGSSSRSWAVGLGEIDPAEDACRP